MAVATAAAMTNIAPKLCSTQSSRHQLLSKPVKKKLMSVPKFHLSSNTSLKRHSPIYASNSPPEEQTPATSPIISQEEWSYLWKLGVGSVGGAALIKYGSVLFPEITRPNIVQALVMILTPVVVATVLLIRQSRGSK
ncbi:uncharacterized protein LOC126681257 [Mercurialis annua]|uniref:uncharacterized protein LOC126681257 n=1 Tax=Mercurialis annua TaxID=3986 RepID=UPI002161036E|nr:uncharacterized protein LOC126681257 [Mercurialis annua]